MPELGERIRGDILLSMKGRSNDYYVWYQCPECLIERWILQWKTKLPNFTGLCQVCNARKNNNRAKAIGEKHPRWNGGQTISRGYVYISNDRHPTCTSKGYVKRARLVLEERLGRYLLPDCVPHHLNHIRNDDRPSNLIELTKSQHTILHAFERRLIAGAKYLGIKEVVDYINKHLRPFFVASTEREWQTYIEGVGYRNVPPIIGGDTKSCLI